MKLVWTRPANRDRAGIRDHILQHDPAAAITLDIGLARKTGRLVEHPNLGRPGRVAGTRELVVHPNDIVIYDVVGETVRVLRILHAARQWPPPRQSEN